MTGKADSSSSTKLPPGIDKTKLSKGATTMTSATYKPQPKTPSSSASATTTKNNIYICVLTAMPGQTDFGDGLATSVVDRYQRDENRREGAKPEGRDLY